MSENNSIATARQQIADAKASGKAATFKTYTKMSGPGWLQGAITLGGGSLGGSLYVGVIGGYEMLWLQPLMMILGIVMLSAIGYVTLSTGRRPFAAINEDINPVLGWGWLIATILANMVWAMPQFSLGTAALQQNLAPGLLGGAGAKYGCAALLFVVAAVVVWFHGRGGKGLKIFDMILKIMVGVVVFSFVGVVVALASEIAWTEVFAGFIPNPSLLFSPAESFTAVLGESAHADYWQEIILGTQRDRMIAAAATAVGINMTFLLPYSMLKRGWDRDFRGLATFDLSIGLFFPFFLATTCVVIASAHQFHGKEDGALFTPEGARIVEVQQKLDAEEEISADEEELIKQADSTFLKSVKGYTKNLAAFNKAVSNNGEKEVTAGDADRKIASMLVKRDADVFASSLEKLTGPTVAHTVFGIGVLGMAVSTIIILMLINGFAVCEMLGKPGDPKLHLIGSIIPGLTGSLGFLFLWSNAEANFWLTVPTSVFGMVLLPIAYVTFFLMMNNQKILGDSALQGGKRLTMNIAMGLALLAATIGAGFAIWSKVKWIGVGCVAAYILLAVIVHFMRKSTPPTRINATDGE